MIWLMNYNHWDMLIQRKPYASIQKQLNSFIDEEGDKVVIGNDNDL